LRKIYKSKVTFIILKSAHLRQSGLSLKYCKMCNYGSISKLSSLDIGYLSDIMYNFSTGLSWSGKLHSRVYLLKVEYQICRDLFKFSTCQMSGKYQVVDLCWYRWKARTNFSQQLSIEVMSISQTVYSQMVSDGSTTVNVKTKTKTVRLKTKTINTVNQQTKTWGRIIFCVFDRGRPIALYSSRTQFVSQVKASNFTFLITFICKYIVNYYLFSFTPSSPFLLKLLKWLLSGLVICAFRTLETPRSHNYLPSTSCSFTVKFSLIW